MYCCSLHNDTIYSLRSCLLLLPLSVVYLVVRPLDYSLLSLFCLLGGVAEERRDNWPSRGQKLLHHHWPQPHHQTGASVWHGQLHVCGQEHSGQKTKHDSNRYCLWWVCVCEGLCVWIRQDMVDVLPFCWCCKSSIHSSIFSLSKVRSWR